MSASAFDSYGVKLTYRSTDSGAITGGALQLQDFSPGPPYNNTAAVALALGCRGVNNVSATELACLRAVPREELLAAALAQGVIADPPFGVPAYRPIIDGDFIPDRPSSLILKGSFVKGNATPSAPLRKMQTYLFTGISIIAAWVEDDSSEFFPPAVNTEPAVVAFFSTLFSNSTRDQLLSLYPVEEFENQVAQDPTQTAQFYRGSRIDRDINNACE